MTFSDLVGFLRTRKGTALSVALHLLVVCWGLFSFSARSVPIPPPEDLVPVDVVSEDNVAKAMQGHKDGDKKNKKALAEKIGDPNPVDDIVGKISTKEPVVADTAPPPTPKTEDKPVEKKPDPPKPIEKKPDPPPKPVAEAKPKDEPKPEEKKPEEKKPDQPKVDPIADAIKKEEKKPPPPKPVAQAAPPPAPPKPKADRVFDQSKIAALLDKRDPTRQAVAGAELNANAALGTSRGHAADNSGTWGSMFQSQVERCWKKPYGSLDQQKPEASFDIRLKRDGTLEAMPVPVGGAATPYLRAYQESALRAIIACQPYNLPPTMFEEWKSFEPVFTDRNI